MPVRWLRASASPLIKRLRGTAPPCPERHSLAEPSARVQPPAVTAQQLTPLVAAEDWACPLSPPPAGLVTHALSQTINSKTVRRRQLSPGPFVAGPWEEEVQPSCAQPAPCRAGSSDSQVLSLLCACPGAEGPGFPPQAPCQPESPGGTPVLLWGATAPL